MDMNDAKIEKLTHLANADAEFRKIKAEFISLETEFMNLVHQLPMEQQDLIYKFVFASDEYDRRILEIACDYIDFSE